jgi:hypothetical protein
MQKIAIAFALIAASAIPALADGDWDDDDYYEDHYSYERRGYHPGVPVYAAPYYVPYGAYFADEPEFYGRDCEVERKWRRGRYYEKIECDDD